VKFILVSYAMAGWMAEGRDLQPVGFSSSGRVVDGEQGVIICGISIGGSCIVNLEVRGFYSS
jgi:hypothetical protein